MGNSAVYRIHTGDDLDAAYAMAQRLLALAWTGCGCPKDILAHVETDTRGLDRYVSIGPDVSLTIPAALLQRTWSVLEPWLSPHERPSIGRDGSAYLITDLTTEVVAALRQVPPIRAKVLTHEHPLPNDLADTVLAAVDTDPASISWDVCWPGNHTRTGFQLGINGVGLWHTPAPAGHSLYVHVHPARPELAHDLAATVGGQVLGEPALGW
jgi:hypothetical protein